METKDKKLKFQKWDPTDILKMDVKQYTVRVDVGLTVLEYKFLEN